MNLKSFINVFCDAIIEHEGWHEKNISYKNLNPGNLTFVGQSGATGAGGNHNFARFANFYAGRAALEYDIKAKIINGRDTIRKVISRYAPPNENDTEAYIGAVVAFFGARNWKLTDTTPFSTIGARKEVLAVLNSIWQPEDWHIAQGALKLCASEMPEFSFSTRYVNRNLAPSLRADGATKNFFIDKDANQSLLKEFNEGQELNILIFNSKGFNLGGFYYGGMVFQGLAVSYDNLKSSFGQVSFGSVMSASHIGRNIFHELIHQLFVRTGDRDTLHEFLESHGGYNANNLYDLKLVYGRQINRYMLLDTAVKVGEEAVGIAKANKDVANVPAIIRLLSALGAFFKNLFK